MTNDQLTELLQVLSKEDREEIDAIIPTLRTTEDRARLGRTILIKIHEKLERNTA
jgi:hypothetical protein